MANQTNLCIIAIIEMTVTYLGDIFEGKGKIYILLQIKITIQNTVGTHQI